MSDRPKNLTPSVQSALEYRLPLLDYFVAIAGTAWGTATVYYYGTAELEIALACGVAALASFVLFLLSRRCPQERDLLANLFIFSTVVALCACTALSIGDYSHASLYFPIVVILAAQLVGMKVAIVWSICMMAAAMLDGMMYPESSLYGNLSQDRLIHNLGTILTALWLSYESEKFFKIRTQHLRDITESLQEKTRLLELAEETAGVGHWRWDFASDTVVLSTEANTICELNHASTESTSLPQFIQVWSEKHHDALSAQLDNAKLQGQDFEYELSFQSSEGLRYVSCRGLCERDESGVVVGVFGTLRDDTELRSATDRLSRKADQLNKLASFDPLTGLTNRFQFQQQLGRIVTRSVEQNAQMALLVLDMDGFKEINDSMGHQAGDEVLKVVAKRLEQVVRSGDVISRLGGDEFTIILRDAQDEFEVETAARRLVEAVSQPFSVDDQELHVGVSIGVSLCPRDSQQPDELFTFADTAMYDAKASKRGMAMYNAEMTAELRSRRSAESRLAGALGREEFRLVYQPQCDLTSNRITGFECLLRWKKDGEEMSPLKFIPLLEGSGKIVEVGQWVLEQSCQQVADWRQRGYDVNMALNISPLQFREAGFAERVIAAIEAHGVDPTWIELEITEGLLIQDLENTAEKLFRLKSYGVQISVDDFGTGYSSLAYLKHLPIDRLKIDRAFIKDIPEHDDGTIASSIIVLGQSLDMRVLAEGVETEAQLEFLKQQDCDAYQGNLFGKPLPPEHWEKMLAKTWVTV